MVVGDAMNPIPLSSTDGTVYAYACGVCRKVRVDGELMSRHSKRDVRAMAARSRANAEECCRCYDCHKPLRRSEPLACAACAEKAAARNKSAVKVHEAFAAERDAETRAKALDFDAAERLRQEMRSISGNTWCAGWLSDLESVLWLEMRRDPSDTDVSPLFDRAALLQLHEKAGGWWMWKDGAGERFVTTEEWTGVRRGYYGGGRCGEPDSALESEREGHNGNT
jgi:hypothetical protein